MRNLLFTLALLFSVNVFAVYPNIWISSAEVVDGKLEVYFNVDDEYNQYTASDSIYFFTNAVGQEGNYSPVYKMAYSDLDTMTIHNLYYYRFEFEIPSTFFTAQMKVNGRSTMVCCGDKPNILNYIYDLVMPLEEDPNTPPITTSTINPTEEKEEIIYYNMQGIKIEKPTQGLYLWKSLKGSGKVYTAY
jgi:hypothetical protein